MMLTQIFAKKARQRRAHVFQFNLFLCAFSIFYYIPHNYVIPQVVRYAIPQTHSSFYTHRFLLTPFY